MRLVYVAEGVPNRDPLLGDGSSMIPFEVIRHAPAGVSITLVTWTSPISVPDEIRARCDDTVMLPVHSPQVAVLRALPSPRSIGSEERASRAAGRVVRELSKNADATLVHGPHAAFLSHRVQGPLVVQVVDPWSLRAAMEAELATGLRRRYRSIKARQALAAERRLPRRARLLTVGRRDAEIWAQRLGRPVRGIPNGTDAPAGGTRLHTDGPPTVCFVGSLNYGPNIDSARTLITELAPCIWAQAPDTRFVLAGRQPDPAVLALRGDRVVVLPNVPSVLEVFRSADVALFPDRRGLGIRNSVTEAIAAGLPVVATPAAAREQQPHPLLSVGQHADELVALALSAIESRGAGDRPAAGGSAPLRTWATVTEEYLAECAAAAVPDSAAGPERS